MCDRNIKHIRKPREHHTVPAVKTDIRYYVIFCCASVCGVDYSAEGVGL